MALKSFGKFPRPRAGEKVLTKYGSAVIRRVLPYAEVIAEMQQGGASDQEIGRFDVRVEHFLGRKSRYFECELLYPDGVIWRLDWSEYLAMRNKSLG